MMRTNRRTCRWAVIGAWTLAVAAGCAGDDDPDRAQPSTTSAAASPTADVEADADASGGDDPSPDGDTGDAGDAGATAGGPGSTPVTAPPFDPQIAVLLLEGLASRGEDVDPAADAAPLAVSLAAACQAVVDGIVAAHGPAQIADAVDAVASASTEIRSDIVLRAIRSFFDLGLCRVGPVATQVEAELAARS